MVGRSTWRSGPDQPDHVHRLLRRLLGSHLLPLSDGGRKETQRTDKSFTLCSRSSNHPGMLSQSEKNIFLRAFVFVDLTLRVIELINFSTHVKLLTQSQQTCFIYKWFYWFFVVFKTILTLFHHFVRAPSPPSWASSAWPSLRATCSWLSSRWSSSSSSSDSFTEWSSSRFSFPSSGPACVPDRKPKPDRRQSRPGRRVCRRRTSPSFRLTGKKAKSGPEKEPPDSVYQPQLPIPPFRLTADAAAIQSTW